MNHIEQFIGIDKKEVYSKFTHQDFWKFINPENKFTYEIRIKNNFDDKKEWEFIKELGLSLNVPFHWTGVFIQTAEQFYAVTVYCIKNHLTCYISANPKRKSIHSKTQKMCYNGEASSDESIFSILLDFDVTSLCKKEFPNNCEEKAYEVAKKFLENNPQIKKYIMICSGNGIQLRIVLDSIINLPNYDSTDFIYFQKILKFAMKSLVSNYNNKYVTIDLSSFELARVGRAPFSINFKNKNNLKYSGIVELCDEGINEGLTSYIICFWNDVVQTNAVSTLYKDKKILKEFEYNEDTIRTSKLVRLLLTPDIPEGGRNNVLFFQFKLLCKANGLNLKSEKIQKLINEMRTIQHDAFPDNEPSNNNFNPNAVNNYCIDYNYPLCYPIMADRKIKGIIPGKIILKNINFENGETLLPEGYNVVDRIIKDLKLNSIRIESKNDGQIELDIQNLLKKIYFTYGQDKLDYLIKENLDCSIKESILQQLIEKI